MSLINAAFVVTSKLMLIFVVVPAKFVMLKLIVTNWLPSARVCSGDTYCVRDCGHGCLQLAVSPVSPISPNFVESYLPGLMKGENDSNSSRGRCKRPCPCQQMLSNPT